ncbi:hypothetical protein ACVINZ_002245 [Mesorhizobium jarvisii]
MSSRGINFLDQWLANNVPETTKADVISVDELTNKLIADAKVRIPTKPAIDSDLKPASHSDFIPAGVPI